MAALANLKKKLLAELAYCERTMESPEYLDRVSQRLSDFANQQGGGFLGGLMSKAGGLLSGMFGAAPPPPYSEHDPLAPPPPYSESDPLVPNAWLKEKLAEVKEAERVELSRLQTDTTVQKDELDDFSLACERLWHLDTNRLDPGVHYKLDLQRGKSSWAQGDFADRPLFAFVDDKVFERKTFRCFMSLLDNYEAETGQSETVTEVERREISEFLDACLDTKPMEYLLNYLVGKGLTRSRETLKKLLHDLWFKLYRREARNDSSGFEHVFVGELRDGGVIGMHSWLQIYNEEKKGEFDYLGYIKPKRRGTNALLHDMEEERLQTIQFKWKGSLKPISTSFMGTSPEFELALYTLCFMCGQDENLIDTGSYRVIVKCHRIARDKIGTSYPEQAPITIEEAASKIQNRVRISQAHKRYGKKHRAPA